MILAIVFALTCMTFAPGVVTVLIRMLFPSTRPPAAPALINNLGQRQASQDLRSCLKSLRQLADAKKNWALEHHKSPNDVPTWEDIRPYLKDYYGCPIHGIHTLGPVCGPPTCSMASESNSWHKLGSGEP